QSAFKLNKKTGRYEQNVTVMNNTNFTIPNNSYVLDNLVGGTIYIINGYTQYLPPIGSPYLNFPDLGPGKSQKFMVEAFNSSGNITYTPRVLAGYGDR